MAEPISGWEWLPAEEPGTAEDTAEPADGTASVPQAPADPAS